MERNVTNMRKRFTESRTYEEAYMIGKQRIDDAIKIYDSYSNRGGGGFYQTSLPILWM